LIFLVDASVYVFRAYHSMLPDMRDRDGHPMHAVFGFARLLGDLIERVRPAYMAVAFDARRALSYRSRLYPPYKANRERAPADLCCSSSAVGSCASTSGSRYSSIRTMRPMT
jgi:5'-3' exonuclease